VSYGARKQTSGCKSLIALNQHSVSARITHPHQEVAIPFGHGSASGRTPDRGTGTRGKWLTAPARRGARSRVKCFSASASNAVTATATPAKTAGATNRQKNAPSATSTQGGCTASQLKKSFGLSTRPGQQDAFEPPDRSGRFWKSSIDQRCRPSLGWPYPLPMGAGKPLSACEVTPVGNAGR
jgi:hypothetical protein